MDHAPEHRPYPHQSTDATFDDLLANNKKFAERFDQHGFDGVAHAGVLMITCMDSRIVPLEMVGLTFGDAKIIRTPGGRVTTSALAGCIAGVHLLQVNRIMVIPHNRCAMAAADDDVIIEKIRNASGADASWVRFGASADQRRTLHRDVEKLRNHPLIGKRALVGGFYYDVDTGLLERWD
ncbi:MAG TPA: carbonic anhydrase [Propionibacteriaceae bacterium]|nr:carbonic anhydrase [Propionibacteriaceae bacterium]